MEITKATALSGRTVHAASAIFADACTFRMLAPAIGCKTPIDGVME